MIIIMSVVLLTATALILNEKTGIERVEAYPSIQNESNKLFCIIATTVWTVLSAFRHVSVGTDTYAYKLSFDAMKYRSWTVLWEQFWNKYVHDEFVKDPGYNLFTKAVHLVTDSYQVFLVIIALIFFIAMGIWIYKNSRIPYVSFLLFSTLFYSFYAVTGHRQTIATAMVVFAGDKYIRERKLLKFLLILLLASTIHASCVCYLLAYIIYPIRNYGQQLYLLLTVAGVLAAVTILVPVWEMLAVEMNYESYLTNDIGGTGTFSALFLLVMLIAIWRFPVIIRNNPDAYGMFNILWVGSMTVGLAFINQSFMRVQQYYNLYLMVLLPEIILSFKGRNRFLVGVGGCGLLFLLLVRNMPYYKFFWQ